MASQECKAMREKRLRILYLAQSAERLEALHKLIDGTRKFVLLTAATADQAVAVCAAQIVALALVDAESLRGQEWSVLRTLKMVNPNLPVIVFDQRKEKRNSYIDEGTVDSVVVSSPEQIVDAINRILCTDAA
jgi:response regulator RpfG family c-di-GMP phosphodiesterase